MVDICPCCGQEIRKEEDPVVTWRREARKTTKAYFPFLLLYRKSLIHASWEIQVEQRKKLQRGLVRIRATRPPLQNLAVDINSALGDKRL